MSKNERQSKLDRRAALKKELRLERSLGVQADPSRIAELSNELNNLNHELSPADR